MVYILAGRLNISPSNSITCNPLPSEWAKEDREIEGSKPDLAEVEEDPSGL